MRAVFVPGWMPDLLVVVRSDQHLMGIAVGIALRSVLCGYVDGVIVAGRDEYLDGMRVVMAGYVSAMRTGVDADASATQVKVDAEAVTRTAATARIVAMTGIT